MPHTPALDPADAPADLAPAARFAAATLHALAREEARGRRNERLLEEGRVTWQRFRGRLGASDLLELLLEDAAATQPFAFDSAQLLAGQAGARVGKLPDGLVSGWLDALPALPLDEGAPDYVASQADRLELESRLARSDLHRGIKAHHRVLELPGTGGQLADHLARELSEVFLQDVFFIAWQDWRERLLAGLVAVEAGLTGTAPVSPSAGLDEARALEAERPFDYVIGTTPDRGLQPHDEATLADWFPRATIVLV